MNVVVLPLTLHGMDFLFFEYYFSYLGFKNIVLYLMTNLGTPSDVIH